MKLFLLFVLTSFLNAQGRAELTPLKASKRDSAVQILTASGSRPIAGRCVDIDVKSQRGELWKGTICIYYEQSSGLYLWDHLLMSAGMNLRVPAPRSLLLGGKMFVSNNQIVLFRYHGIVQSSGKASSLDDAERLSLLAATAKLHSDDSALISPLRQRFNSGLLEDFGIAAYDSHGMNPSVVDVQLKNSQWLVTVQGLWKEIVTLDANFQHVSHSPAPGETPKYWSTR